MPRTKNGLPGIYNATPLVLPDGVGSALAVNASGQLIAAAPSGSSANQVQGTAADNNPAVGYPVLTGGIYNSAAPTYANGDVADLQVDINGNLKVTLATTIAGENIAQDVLGVQTKPTVSATYSWTAFTAPLNDVDISVKGTPGNLFSLTASNINAAIRYLQVFNKATAPTGGDTAVYTFAIPAGTSTAPAIREVGSEFFGSDGYYFSTGIAVGISTVAATFTAATTTDHTTNGSFI